MDLTAKEVRVDGEKQRYTMPKRPRPISSQSWYSFLKLSHISFLWCGVFLCGVFVWWGGGGGG